MKKIESDNIRSLLRQYSLSANIIAEVTRSLRHKINKRYEKNLKSKDVCLRSVGAGLEKIGDKYAKSDETLPNRRYISNWIKHAEANGYKLIFSFIPSKNSSADKTYPFIKKFIQTRSGKYSSFDDFCDSNCRKVNEVYYQIDGHFNEIGNQFYAEYLAEVIEASISINH